MIRIKAWFKSGAPWVWLNAAAVSTCLIMVVGVLGLIVVRGAGHFWPAPVVQFSYQEPDGQTRTIIGEHVDTSITPAAMAKSSGHIMADDEDTLVQYLVKTGNRDITGTDFRWILERNIKQQQSPAELMVVERREWGNFYGQLVAVKESGKVIAEGEQAGPVAQARINEALAVFDEIAHLEKKEVGGINYKLDQLRLEQKGLQLKNRWDAAAEQRISVEKAELEIEYKKYQAQLLELYKQIRRDSLVAKTESGQEVEVPLAKVVRVYWPNTMSMFDKIGHYGVKVVEFLTDDPREANTEGGIFPAIFGTVMMVLMMSVIVTPFGVIAAVYLREYAKQGFITRLIRIAVNNLAGVPSIVYGVFGLGFFVYILGGNIDQLFYPEAAPAPVYGTPGLLWASITLALLTLPVVIVSTEEGLARIPRSIREGSLALGATKLETLWLTVLPMASPAMMTGLILAVARAAGEVAPLMLVGVVKLAPTLPLDGNYPFLHLDRKFMHLGFHIYDVGFQSPNVEAARPLVYATSLLLVLVIVGLNLSAILIRNHLREKYRALEG
ncbi:MAG: phosphate ABC transporter permease PstA [Methylobacter tundripaludum]|uniref:Phosphate transport system permease protein PstA n=1 Tax=Methylobacter tundripaludum TaxID=173365 RepID=A0A2S6H844_9GAMM|nr:phosphate ABC transporter permease PstA [Methylobacter tundripaludum]MCF7964911.1 phosphate ABC transporter permease PstA [Methylobacter tundripaludum]MCK9637646.1 phosphate ABC transporter permease PstA [Methylobacter tundripaludum]PPK73662.1 phosphate transport system permease protein [Methylobacter tundripaludum]